MSNEAYEAMQGELSASQTWCRILFSLLLAVLISIIIYASYRPQPQKSIIKDNSAYLKSVDSLFENTYFVSKKDFKLLRVIQADTLNVETIIINK